MLFTTVMHYTSNITSLSVIYSLPPFIICRLYYQYDVRFQIQKLTYTMLTQSKENLRKQGRQCTYNVTLKRVRVAIVAVEKQQVLHILSLCVCVWGLIYPACSAHALYCHLWPVCLYHIFLHQLIQRHDFRKYVTECRMCVVSLEIRY